MHGKISALKIRTNGEEKSIEMKYNYTHVNMPSTFLIVFADKTVFFAKKQIEIHLYIKFRRELLFFYVLIFKNSMVRKNNPPQVAFYDSVLENDYRLTKSFKHN